jgi:MFS family permease
MAIVSGYLFDIFGRKITLFLSTSLSGLAYVLYAVYSPNQSLYQLNALYFNIMIAPFLANPLSTDYVRKESRGAALGLAFMGLSLGTILSLSVLF